MGTRAEIYVKGEDGIFGLWKHYDGTPELISYLTKKTLELMNRDGLSLKCAEYFTAYMIIQWYKISEEHVKRWEEEQGFKTTPFADVRPIWTFDGKRTCKDFEWIHIIDLTPRTGERAVIRSYHIYWDMPDDDIYLPQIREKGFIEWDGFDHVVEHVIYHIVDKNGERFEIKREIPRQLILP